MSLRAAGFRRRSNPQATRRLLRFARNDGWAHRCYNARVLNDALSADVIARDLKTRVIGARVNYFARVESTNDIAAQLADAGEAEGIVIIADEQTRGRGRMQRAWHAPKASSILLSIVLRPPTECAAQIGMAIALGICDGICAQTNLAPQIKWHNDILVNGKKCAGILLEAKTVGEKIEYVVAGLGLNVNFAAASVKGIPRDATTLADERDAAVPRAPLAREILRALDAYYARLVAGADLHREWRARLATLGQRVRVTTARAIVEGIAQDVDADGALIVQRADGSRERILVGDVMSAH